MQQEYSRNMKYAKVSVLKRPGEFDQLLTYKIPANLSPKLTVGQGVSVELRDKITRGIVISLESEISVDIKNVREVQDFLPDLSLDSLTIEMVKKIADYYQCSLLRALKLFVPKTLWQGKGKRTLLQVQKQAYAEADHKKFPLVPFEFSLTAEQELALKAIKKEKRPVLLHGVTGSGKTEVYLRIILETIKKGKQAILLVPEIALTPQMIDYFQRYFGSQVALFHSKLSDGQRLHEWYKVQSGYAPLVIGSRSAIFAPVRNLGVIIMDEEHEWTYKQESSPYYETHRIAEMMKEMTSCHLILGTATPRLETYYKAEAGEYAHIKLSTRINSFSLPKVEVVDLREEFKRKNFSIFSQSLFSKIQDRLKKKEQIILFVNQRGMARAVVCRDCGLALTCPECEVSLKLHGGSYGTTQFLLCHYCSYRAEPQLACPYCNSLNIRHAGLGTERVEEELSKIFPGARVVRADKDTTSDKRGFEPIYEAFKKKEYDILVGTQMVAKGLDFPHVTLIGIMLADIGLHVPDFRSHERLFHIITQVSGRAGRGKTEGEVVLQTYQPKHHAIRMAADYAYDDFVAQELTFRKRLKYPPFSHLIKFVVTGLNQEKLKKHVKEESEVLEDIFKVNNLPVMITVAPAMIPKIGPNYYYHVLLRSENPHLIFKHWKVPKTWRIDIDPVHTT